MQQLTHITQQSRINNSKATQYAWTHSEAKNGLCYLSWLLSQDKWAVTLLWQHTRRCEATQQRRRFDNFSLGPTAPIKQWELASNKTNFKPLFGCAKKPHDKHKLHSGLIMSCRCHPYMDYSLDWGSRNRLVQHRKPSCCTGRKNSQ